jgi:hypothetical protein
MFSGVIRHFSASMILVACFGTATGSEGIAAADPSQDQKFFDLLGEENVPPVDGENGLVITAHKVCSKLDDGMPVDDMVELIRNNGFNDNPLTRLQNQGRITRTIHKFITAAVEVYCPGDKGKIASIAAYRAAGPRIELVSLTQPIDTGEINPTKPLPVPVQQPAPVPQEIQPVPLEPPPPPRYVKPPPKQAPPPPPQEPPPPAEAPNEGPPAAGPPAAGPPAPSAPSGGAGGSGPGAPGGDTGGGPAPAPQTPDQPAPPGHIRLAP